MSDEMFEGRLPKGRTAEKLLGQKNYWVFESRKTGGFLNPASQ